MQTRRDTDDRNRATGHRPGARLAALMLAGVALSTVAGCAMFGSDDGPRSQRPSNKWRVAFEMTARSDGTIDFLVEPVGGSAVTVSVPVAINQTDEEIATAAHRAFTSTLGASYEINPPTGTDIHVRKASRKEPDFSLALVRLTVQDVKVDIDRE